MTMADSILRLANRELPKSYLNFIMAANLPSNGKILFIMPQFLKAMIGSVLDSQNPFHGSSSQAKAAASPIKFLTAASLDHFTGANSWL
jgi:hypothetical protein